MHYTFELLQAYVYTTLQCQKMQIPVFFVQGTFR